MSIRPVKRLARAKPAREGAGVHLRRAFGFGNTADFDRFLVLDDFRNDVPTWQGSRGIRTAASRLSPNAFAGTVEHGDSIGNRGVLVSAKPLREPVAWYGPIVMNTQEQLQEAFEQLREGTFLKSEGKK